LVNNGAERSEALAAVGVGPHSVSRGWGPRNKLRMLIQSSA
jgi:hypothetical protein